MNIWVGKGLFITFGKKPMKLCKHFLPDFRTTCIIVSVLYILMAGSLFVKGLVTSMSEFRVPPLILNSPHYFDAIFWVYTHMIVIGILIGCAGLYAEGEQFKKVFSRVVFLVHVFYTYLDFRTSDSFLGNSLYKGDASIIPAIFTLVVTLLFLHLSYCKSSRNINRNPA